MHKESLNPSLNNRLILEFKAVFRESKKNISDYLEGISKEMLLRVGAHFLAIRKHDSQFAEPKDFLGMFFRHENQEFANKVYARILELEEEHKTKVFIPLVQSSLQLFEHAFESHIDDQTQTQSEAESEVNIFKAYLVLNEQNTARDEVASKSTENLPTDYKHSALILAQTLPYFDIEHFNVAEQFTCQLIKAALLFKFLEENERTSTLLQEFLNHFGCESWKEYLKRLIPICGSIIQKKNEGLLTINLKDDEKREDNIEFLDKFILPVDEDITDIEFRTIRSSPLAKILGNQYLVIYDLFIFEKIFKGLYFTLNSINRSLPKETQISNFRSFYGDNFSEKSLFYSTINRIFNGRYIQYTGSELLDSGMTAEPDYYIRNGNKVLLFESKDFLLNADIKSSSDYNLIEAELAKKLYKDGKNNKAILQLLNNVKRLLAKKFSVDTAYKESSLRIYPIIIVHDKQCIVPAINVLLNRWYEDELVKLDKEGFEVQNVRPVTIMSIDTLLYNENVLAGRKLDLSRVIDDYHKQTIIKKKKVDNELELKQLLMNSLLPFDNYFNALVGKQKLRKSPSMLREVGLSLFE